MSCSGPSGTLKMLTRLMRKTCYECVLMIDNGVRVCVRQAKWRSRVINLSTRARGNESRTEHEVLLKSSLETTTRSCSRNLKRTAGQRRDFCRRRVAHKE